MSFIKLTDLDLAGKRVLIRADLNVPVKDGKVTSDARITASMPTVEHCARAGAKVMVMSHRGRPQEGQVDEENSMQPIAEDMSAKLGKPVRLIKDYLENRENDINAFNEENKIDKDLLINGRNMTNIGVFRKFVETYIEQHSAINKDMIIMTRQLAPTTQGIPIEIYAFSKDKRWQNYEYIMADIFDYIIASTSYFDLEIFELPTRLSANVN